MENELEIKTLQEMIDKSKHLVFFGGAGVSTESGIPDFRSENGLYHLKSKYDEPYEVMLSHHYFENNTKTFFEFYREFMINKSAKPNITHKYLANKERLGKDITIITQNIDGLHQLAGSKNVIELHGSIHRNFCTKCGKQYSLDEFSGLGNLPLCTKCGGVVKPDVVLYEEPLNEMVITKALIALQKADCLIVAGTSLNVYPANTFINYFFGDNIAVINLTDLKINRPIKLFIKSKIGKIFGNLH